MKIVETTSCPVCGGSRFEPFLSCTDHFVSGETFLIKRCTDCGLKITAGAPDEDEIGPYYQSERYISHSDTSRGMVNRLYHLVRKTMLVRKYRLIQKRVGQQPGSILDIGAGTGYFLRFMQQRGWQVTGIEKSEQARQFARDEWNLELLPAAQLADLPAQSFEVVTLWHVMEHLQNLEYTWKRLTELIRSGGLLVVALPNPASYDARHYREYWAAWDVPRHLWHFEIPHIRQAGEKHGFRLEKIQRMPFDAFYVSMLSERYRNASAPLLRGLITGKLSWIASWFDAGKCSSLIYVFRKD